MSEYLHGAYGRTQTAGSRVAANSASAVVAVGTAPVQNIPGGATNVNKPIVLNSMAEAKAAFGYSDDWADFTLCEAFHVFFEQQGVGPLIAINVLDPSNEDHLETTGGTASLTPSGGAVTISNAEKIVLDSVKIGAKVLGTDYTIAYNSKAKTIVATEKTAGGLGTSALSCTWDIVKPSAVTGTDVIGTTDGLGSNTGLHALANVYPLTGYIPSFLIVPGFSGTPAVHTAMAELTQKINGHWDCWMFTDIPLAPGGTALTLDTVVTWKNTNGYTCINETTCFPMVLGTDSKTYHLSVLRAANFQKLLAQYNGIPYHSASNTECPIISNLYMGADNTGRVYDDTLINNKLNKNGIDSAAFVSGHWALWGAHAAGYDQTNGDNTNVAETNLMMLYYISNDFQYRRNQDVDKPMSRNDIQTIAAEEQARLDGLVSAGALTFGEAYINATPIALSDMMQGDYTFTFRVTATPLTKSLTALVVAVDDGYATYFGIE